MSLGRIASAVVLSLGLHLAAVGLLRARSQAPSMTPEPQRTLEVPLTILGGGHALVPGRADARAPDRSGGGRARGGRGIGSAEEGVLPAGLPEIQLITVADEEGPAVEEDGAQGEAPGATLLSGASGDGAIRPGSQGVPGLGSGPSPAIDLQPFIDRLRRSAERCGSVAPRGRGSDRGSRAQVGLVRFCVAPDGAPTALSLVESTGDQALDRAALECIVPGAAPLPAADRCLVVPLRFH
jgi:TonB family protein